jgi:hypothetical protein
MQIVGGELRDEIEGTTDKCAWMSRAELDNLRLVEIGAFGIGLAFPDLAR